MKKKLWGRISVVSLAVSILCVITLGTYAVITAQTQVSNVFTTGNVKVSVNVGSSRAASDDDAILPGRTVESDVTIENEGNNPAYVRVKVIPRADGTDISDAGVLSLDLNTDDWSYNEDDGYYYYLNALESGGTTSSLFDSFTFLDNEAAQQYYGSDLTISIYASAVQSANNGQDVWEATGWPEVETE